MSPLATRVDLQRHQLRVTGVVQGVGFRPFVYRLAHELGLVGLAGNDSLGVFVEIEGDPISLACFEARLVREAPPLARIDEVITTIINPVGEEAFRIAESDSASQGCTYVSPDVAVCADCLAEMRSQRDRRYRYPFINCTNCGPRFTITLRLPYDRANTTMAKFKMCSACSAEYHDPSDRRFHAEPIACADCGPRLRYEDAGRSTDDNDDAIAAAQEALLGGAVVAVKGLGGYHLACDATRDASLAELRDRKARGEKPFAVMVKDLQTARALACIDAEEARLLESPQRPIVLLRRRQGAPISELVAPSNPYLGIVLPYTPLHHLLFAQVPGRKAPPPRVLVMTSGNLSEEPICYDDSDARRRLTGLVDAWLTHDRPIHVPCDDSVMRIDEGLELPIRRSRGYAPLPVRLPLETPPVLAVGGELKNTFCVAAGRDAWMSQHIGDMGSVETLHAFERSVQQFEGFYGVNGRSLAADSHPRYQTRCWADRQGWAQVVSVQHHHAHVAAAMAEHGLPAGKKVIGFAFDGTGYGDDGAIWGGEVLVAGYNGYERFSHLAYVPLPGGDATIHRPYRAALAHLWTAGVAWADDLYPVQAASATELAVLARQLDRAFACVATSSMGRLFDAVSSLLGLRQVVSYEAQAAIELELAAQDHLGQARIYDFTIDVNNQFEAAQLLRQVIADLRADVPVGAIAAGFHLAVARLVEKLATLLAAQLGLTTVVLSGGVFQNVLLTRLVRQALEKHGLEVLTHRLVPPNDGGLALGQVAVAASQLARDKS